MRTKKRKRGFSFHRLKHKFRWDWYGGAFYDFFARTRSLRLQHVKGFTVGYSTDSFGSLSRDRFAAKRYTLTKKYGKAHWLDSGKQKLDSVYKANDCRNTRNGLGQVLAQATYDNGYSNYKKDDVYFDVYRFTFLDRLVLIDNGVRRQRANNAYKKAQKKNS